MKHVGAYHPNALLKDGPIVRAYLTPAAAVVQDLGAKKQPVPNVQVPMMIDTGATMTVIENQFALGLNITPHRFQKLRGFSGIEEQFPVYKMAITLAVGHGKTSDGITYSGDIVGVSPPKQSTPHKGLIGRDFLSHFPFYYDGPMGRFEVIVTPEKQKALWPSRPPIVPLPAGEGNPGIPFPDPWSLPPPIIVQAAPPPSPILPPPPKYVGVPRNLPCPCGSGTKYKKCHGNGTRTDTDDRDVPETA